MIFVTLGSQKFQFNRLLKEIDRLIEEGSIEDEVFAQIGYSDYIPKNYEYNNFLDREAFNNVMSKCNKVITHGGTGAIVGALKKDKQVIAVPRLKKFEEHVDDHQLQIIEQFEKMNMILSAKDIAELKGCLEDRDDLVLRKYISNTVNIIESLEEYIEKRL